MKYLLFFRGPISMKSPPIGKWKVAVVVCASMALTTACNGQENNPLPLPSTEAAKPVLLFKSGFEGTTRIVPDMSRSVTNGFPQKENFVGSDDPASPSDWKKDIETSPYFSESLLNYEQGEFSQRRAEIVPDPDNPQGGNRVVRFRINDEHITLRHGNDSIEKKARIQLELFNLRAAPPDGYLKEYYQKCRLYFSPTFKVLEDAPADARIGWLVMQEFWNDPHWNAPNGDGTFRQKSEARTGVEVVRAGGKLRFGAKGRDPVMEVPRPGNNSWEVINTDFAIPFGKWMTQEIYVREGGTNTGHFYMAITVDGKKTVIVDKIGTTTSEKPGYVPDGQTSWTPFKVYMEGKVAKWFKQKEVPMDVYWDDLEIWQNRRP